MSIFEVTITGKTKPLSNSFFLRLLVEAERDEDVRLIAMQHQDAPNPHCMKAIDYQIHELTGLEEGRVSQRSTTLDAYNLSEEA